jgi:RNA polymerase sigma-70 factor (ECF subfamily)
MRDASDAELLAAAKSEREAFGAFYRRHVTAVLAFCVRRSDAEAGADLTAETFATALLRSGDFDARRGEASAWLFGIARNLVANYHRTGAIQRRAQRRLGMERVTVEPDDLDRIENLASPDVSAQVLAESLTALPDDLRVAVVARVVQNRTYDEIAEASGVSSVAARKRVSRGLAALRQRLGGRP